MTEDTSLREKALRATKGNWKANGAHVHTSEANICSASEPYASETVGYTEIGWDTPGSREAFANAAYIAAADPQTILALLDASEAKDLHIEALEAALKDQIAFYAMDLTCIRGHADVDTIKDIEYRRDKARAALSGKEGQS